MRPKIADDRNLQFACVKGPSEKKHRKVYGAKQDNTCHLKDTESWVMSCVIFCLRLLSANAKQTTLAVKKGASKSLEEMNQY